MPASVRFHRNREHDTIGCTIGLAPHVYVGAYSTSKEDALHQAASLAAEMKAALDNHPELRAALSILPGGSAALTAIASASELVKAGGTVADIARNVGPQVARTVGKILSLF